MFINFHLQSSKFPNADHLNCPIITRTAMQHVQCRPAVMIKSKERLAAQAAEPHVAEQAKLQFSQTQQNNDFPSPINTSLAGKPPRPPPLAGGHCYDAVRVALS